MLKQKKAFKYEKTWTPTTKVYDTNMAAVLLVWDTNMADATRNRNWLRLDGRTWLDATQLRRKMLDSAHARKKKTTWSIFAKFICFEATYPRNVVEIKKKKKKKKKWQLYFSMVLLCFNCHCNRSKIILVEIFREIVVEKIMQPKNDSQTQWLIPICHVSTRTWLLVLSMFHRLTCLSTYLETLTVISSTAMVYPQSPSIASNDFSIYYSFLRPQL